jgi:dodecin
MHATQRVQALRARACRRFGRASRTLRHVGWFEVLETRGHVEDGKVAHYQVTLKVGFTLDDDD